MLHVYKEDNTGNILLEFVTPVFRCGISLGKKQENCSWFIVTKRGEVLPDIMECDVISQEDMNLIRKVVDSSAGVEENE